MAANGTPEQPDNDQLQASRPSGGPVFNIPTKWLLGGGGAGAALLSVIAVVSLFLTGATGCGAGDGGSDEWIDDCVAVSYQQSRGFVRPDELEKLKDSLPEACECINDYLIEYWGPNPPLHSEFFANPAADGTTLRFGDGTNFDDATLGARLRDASARLRYSTMLVHANSFCSRP